jgi:protein-S-isoprenylcysteine O-methyltransferase Ste14
VKRFIQVIQPAVLIILVLVVFYLRFDARTNPWGGDFNFDMAFVLAYVLWLCYEFNVGSADTGRKKAISDIWTAVVYGLGHALVILTALWFGPLWDRPEPWHLASAALFAAGIALRTWAVRALGVHYSHLVAVGDDHRVVDTGPYRLLRHPAYAGMILAHSGVVIWFFNMVTLIMFLCALIPGIVGRILVEEKAIMNVNGYAAFAKTRARLIPFVW